MQTATKNAPMAHTWFIYVKREQDDLLVALDPLNITVSKNTSYSNFMLYREQQQKPEGHVTHTWLNDVKREQNDSLSGVGPIRHWGAGPYGCWVFKMTEIISSTRIHTTTSKGPWPTRKSIMYKKTRIFLVVALDPLDTGETKNAIYSFYLYPAQGNSH